MITHQEQQLIGQLEKRKGGYFYVKIQAEVVNQFEQKRHTRFLCTLDGSLTFRCGLNHFGDGNYFIILGGKNLKSIGKKLGDPVLFELREDPDPLGVPMPEVLEALLEQDESLKQAFDLLSMGKKRHIIHSIAKLKDIDKQVAKAISLIREHTRPPRKKHP